MNRTLMILVIIIGILDACTTVSRWTACTARGGKSGTPENARTLHLSRLIRHFRK